MNEGVDKARHTSPRGREKKDRGARGMEAARDTGISSKP